MSGIGMSGGPGARRLTITVFIACANALTAFDATADAGLLQGLLATIDVAHNMSKYNWVAGENEALLPSVAEWSIRGRPVPADLRSIPIPAIPAVPAGLGPRALGRAGRSFCHRLLLPTMSHMISSIRVLWRAFFQRFGVFFRARSWSSAPSSPSACSLLLHLYLFSSSDLFCSLRQWLELRCVLTARILLLAALEVLIPVPRARPSPT